MKGCAKVFYDSLAILKEWGMIGLVKGYMWESVWYLFSRSTMWIYSLDNREKKNDEYRGRKEDVL